MGRWARSGRNRPLHNQPRRPLSQRGEWCRGHRVVHRLGKACYDHRSASITVWLCANSLDQRKGQVAFREAVASRQHLRRLIKGEQNIRLVQKPIQVAILVIDADEIICHRNVGG